MRVQFKEKRLDKTCGFLPVVLIASISALSRPAMSEVAIPKFAIESNFICEGNPSSEYEDVKASTIISVHAIFRQLYRMEDGYFQAGDPFATFSNTFPAITLERPPGKFYLQYLFYGRFHYALSDVNNKIHFSTSFATLESWLSEKVEQRLKNQVLDPLWRINHCSMEIGGKATIKIHRDSFQSRYAEMVFLASMNARLEQFGILEIIKFPTDADQFLELHVRSALLHPELRGLTLTRINENLRFINDRFPGALKPLSKLTYNRCEEPLL